MNILITGGAGYIGSHCAKLLKMSGFHPVVLDNLTRSNKGLVRFGPLIVGDCRDTLLVRSILCEYQIQSVFHLAGYSYVEESVQKPFEYYSNNVGGLLSVLEAMDAEGVGSLVFSSSCTVYGNHSEPVTEETPLAPLCPYAKSKAICEKIISAALESSNIKSVILRFFNVAGCDEEGEIGENHDPETHILPLILKSILNGVDSFKVFGGDYNTPDGTCVRDYIHVSDVADAHVRSLTHLKNGGDSKIYNLARSEGISNLQLVRAVQNITGTYFDVPIAPRRAGDEAVLVGDANLIEKELGWKPLNSSLKNMVQTAWAWELKQRKEMLRSSIAPQQKL